VLLTEPSVWQRSGICLNEAGSFFNTNFEDNGGSVGHMGAIPPSSRGDKDVERRSQRVMLKVSLVVLASNKSAIPASYEPTSGASCQLIGYLEKRMFGIFSNKRTIDNNCGHPEFKVVVDYCKP
jgi:hypothetical protein